MIKYFVRTTGERQLDPTLSQIEYTLLIDKEHKPVKSFIEQLEIISDYDAVFLEDDVQLCRDFKQRIEDIIKVYPDRVINFFTAPTNYFMTREAQTFFFNQCTYYPKGLAKEIAREMRDIESKEPGKHQYDVLESMALKNMELKHIQYRPCLVQHLDFKSLVGNRDNYRITPYFVDYLEDLNIQYEEAKLHKNIIELKYKIIKELGGRLKK